MSFPLKNIVKSSVKKYLRHKGWAPLPPALSSAGRKNEQLLEAVRLFNKTTANINVREVSFTQAGPVIELRDGRRYHLDIHTKAGRMWTVPFTGTFEPDESAFVRNNVKPGDIAIDVGANFGWFTLMLSQLVGANGAQGQVHAFEPVQETTDLLNRNAQLNNATNIHISGAALDAQDATRDLYLPDIAVSGSFALHHYNENYQVQKVPTMTLDTYVRLHNLPRVDFIKADIEGAELNMLKGASDTLKRFAPTLMLEVQASSTRLFGHEPAEVHTFLKDHGYEGHILETGGKTRSLDDAAAPETAYNFVFTKRGTAISSITETTKVAA